MLFPQVGLPLHIFELRYRKMVADALGGHRTIGMTLLPVLFSNTLDDLPLEQQILALIWAAAIIAAVILRVLYRGFRYTLRRHGIDTRRGASDNSRVKSESRSHNRFAFIL